MPITAPTSGRAPVGGVGVDAESVAFASFNESDYVYKIDHTDTFDGSPITASFTLNPMHVHGPGRYQRINVGHVHGIASGEFEIQTRIGVNYQPPSPQISRCKMSGAPGFAKFRHKARGRDFAIEVKTVGAAEHTIQVLEFPDLSIRKMER